MSDPPAEPEARGTARLRRPRLPARLTVLATGLFLLFALAAVAIALRGDWAAWSVVEGQAGAYAWRLSIPWLALALACGIAALLFTGAVWASLFRAAGGRAEPAEATAAWLGSNLGRYLPGKVWQLTSLAAYVRARGDSGATAFAISLALQAAVLATGAAVAAVLLGGRAFGAASPWTLALAVAAVGAALHPAVLRRLVVWGARALREPPPAEGRPLAPRRLLSAGAAGILIWCLYGVGFWALGRGLVSASPLSPSAATGVFAGGYLIGYLVLLAPGGLVVREGAIAGFLGAAAGVPLGPATAIALAARLWTTAAELLAFGLAAGLGLRRRR